MKLLLPTMWSSSLMACQSAESLDHGAQWDWQADGHSSKHEGPPELMQLDLPIQTMQHGLTSQGQRLAYKRCWQLLHEGVTPLEHDLGLLAADEACDDSEAQIYLQQLQHYRKVQPNSCFADGA